MLGTVFFIPAMDDPYRFNISQNGSRDVPQPSHQYIRQPVKSPFRKDMARGTGSAPFPSRGTCGDPGPAAHEDDPP